MESMFYECKGLCNQPIGSWKISSLNRCLTSLMLHAASFLALVSGYVGPGSYQASWICCYCGLEGHGSELLKLNTAHPLCSRGHDLMHHALLPPCQPGRAPGQNALMCERCGVGQYSTGDSCQGCPPGGKLSFWVNMGLYHCFWVNHWMQGTSFLAKSMPSSNPCPGRCHVT